MSIPILHVVTYMGRGGLETMLMNYYRNIDHTKVQFDFLTHRDFKADYDDEIETLGGKIYHLPRLIPWSISYHRALDAFFTEHPEYKIVHVHQDCLSSVILKAAKEHGVPVRIAHSHCNDQDKNIKYLIKLYYRSKISLYATKLFACSDEAGKWMFRKEKYDILRNAIDTQKYKYNFEERALLQNELKIQNKIVIGHVGRFSLPKNHLFLLDVFEIIKERCNNAVLLLVGDGELRSEVEKKVQEKNLTDSVIFTGVRDDVPQLMQVMDAFVLPSRYEGLGIVAIEAQAAGIPCFLSDAVSDAALITDLANKIPLRSNSEEWARIILNSISIERKDTSELVKKAGYDIEENARWLQNYYLEQWKANT